MTTNQTTAVATRQTDPAQSLAKMLNDAMPELRRIDPKYVNITRMVSLAIEAKMRNELLAQCSPVSVLNFCKKCAEAGTDRVGAGGMWPVPFWNKKGNGGKGCYDMQPMPDWRLIIEKAKKAKAIKHATAEAVYENDVFSYSRGMNPSLIHEPALSDRGKLVRVYCVYTMPDGEKDFCVMDIGADVDPIRKRSKAADAGPWVTDFTEMAKKTVVKRALKVFEGASPELTALIETDNAAVGYAETTVEVREPVAMPKVIEATATETTQTTPTESAAPAEHDGQMSVTGTIEAVEIATSKPGVPKPWKKYGVKIGEARYATFKSDVGELAESLKGKAVQIVYTTNERGYHDIVSLQAATVEAGSEGPGGEDDPTAADRKAKLADLAGWLKAKKAAFSAALVELSLEPQTPESLDALPDETVSDLHRLVKAG